MKKIIKSIEFAWEQASPPELMMKNNAAKRVEITGKLIISSNASGKCSY